MTYFFHNIIIFLRNIRFAQLSFHYAAVLMGSTLYLIQTHNSITIYFTPQLTVLFVSIACAWIFSIALNDYYDITIDRICNNHRPLVRGHLRKNFFLLSATTFGIMAICASFFVNPITTAFIVAYLITAILYNMPPLRLKRFPFVGTFLIALSLHILVFVGFGFVQNSLIQYPFTLAQTTLLIMTFTLIAPIKDFKDVAGDKKGGVTTLPILYGEFWSRIIVSVGIGAICAEALILLRNITPSTIALAIGSTLLASGVLFASRTSQKIRPDNLVWWMLPIAILFNFVLFFPKIY